MANTDNDYQECLLAKETGIALGFGNGKRSLRNQDNAPADPFDKHLLVRKILQAKVDARGRAVPTTSKDP